MFRHKSRDQNTNYRKFKMAEGRHFKNVFFRYISDENHSISTKFGMQMQILVTITATSQISKFCKSNMAAGRHVENRFLGISQRFIVRLTRKLARRSKITLDLGHVTQTVSEAAIICPTPCKLTFDLLILESGVRVTCDVCYICANFSLPRPLCSRPGPMYATDRQTSDMHHHLMAPTLGAGA